MIRIWTTVKRRTDGQEMLVSSVYYASGSRAVPEQVICKWKAAGEHHMATLNVDEVEPIA